VSEEDNKGQ